MTNSMTIAVAQMIPCTEAEGPGKRFALWFQGCPLRCPGCCNPEFLPFHGGEAWTLADLVHQIEQAQQTMDIEGITLLGGEPLAHASASAQLAKAAKERRLTVMVFTGYTLEQALAMHNVDVDTLLAHTDILVDGPYDRTKPDTSRRWIGSTNQQIHFFTNRYHAEEAYWKERNTLEIRLTQQGLSVNGFPAPIAVGLWKRPKPIQPEK